MNRPAIAARTLTAGVVARALLVVLSAALLFLVWPARMLGPATFVAVSGQSMDDTYADGDLILAHRQLSYAVGDVITYKVRQGEVGAGASVIHRIIGGDGKTGFITQGDNRRMPDAWHPTTSEITGRSAVRIRGGADWFGTIAQPVTLGALCAGLTVFVMLLPRRPKALA